MAKHSDLELPKNQDRNFNDKTENPAVDLIRQKVAAAYAQEPDAAVEAAESKAILASNRSKHQKFIYELATSGKSWPEIQTAWHDYYAGLSDVEKHQVWQEFYESQSYALPQTVAQKKEKKHLRIFARKRPQVSKKSPLRSLVFGLSFGALAVFITLFGFFNERFIAPFIQPSRSLSNVPLITNSPVGQNPEIIIPKINVQIPVIYGVNSIDERAVQKALEDGVLHYADTALPGQNGNVVIVGHSSNNIFNKGKYKFAFVLLSRLEPGDTFYLQKDGKRYTYQIYQKKIVKPNDVSVLGPADRPATATLITCDPPGTSINRLVVTGEQISPDPAQNQPKSTDNILAGKSRIIPSNAPSLWSRLWTLLSR
jgi:sortase A